MLFYENIFMFAFLPLALLGYFLLNKFRLTTIAKIFLIFTSLVFYGYWNIKYLPILIFSILFNFLIGNILINKPNRAILFLGIITNLLILGYFKYMDFFIANINVVFNSHIGLFNILLPIGISFFTFQQIAYMVDCYNKNTKEYNFWNYSLFIVFFPQLIAGPIVHHSEMMPQFASNKNKLFNWKNFSEGLFLFFIGLFKKLVIADTLAIWADIGFNNPIGLSFLEGWSSVLCYTFQIYYDFSGYTDMALGIGKMFNINLPQNFNNPYNSESIQEFWRRWHITLSRFLKNYLYIPLGGNRSINWLSLKSNYINSLAPYINSIIVFLLCGLWHGASWMFVIWGMMHGIAICINRFWKNLNIKLPFIINRSMTFVFINFAWVFFRAENMDSALKIIKSLLGFNGFYLPKIYGIQMAYKSSSNIAFWDISILLYLIILYIVIFQKVLHKNFKNLKLTTSYFYIFAMVVFLVILAKLEPSSSPFLYFNF